MVPRKGFTLIELMIVVTILAILTGAAIPYVQDYVEDARLSKTKSDLDEIKGALALFETKRNEVYTDTTGATLVNKGYLTVLPIDPWGAAYVVSPASGTVSSRGPDGTLSNGDDVTGNYQPPLAMTSAYWVDGNLDSMVDTTNDKILVKFTRPLKSSGVTGVVSGGGISGTVNTAFSLTAGGGGAVSGYDLYGKVIQLTLGTTFTPGKDTITVITNQIKDGNGTSCTVDTLKIVAK